MELHQMKSDSHQNLLFQAKFPQASVPLVNLVAQAKVHPAKQVDHCQMEWMQEHRCRTRHPVSPRMKILFAQKEHHCRKNFHANLERWWMGSPPATHHHCTVDSSSPVMEWYRPTFRQN